MNKVKTLIKIKDLIEYPFPIQKEAVGLYDFEYILQQFNLEYYDLDNDKFTPALFQIKVIYNNAHDSDEDSYRYLLFFKGEFACLYGYTGDRGSSTVLFASKEQKFALRSYFESLLFDYEDESNIITEEIDLTDSYTIFFEQDNEFYYHINSPYWCYSFNNNVKNLYYIEDNKTFTPIEFVKFKVDPRKSKTFGEHYKPENQFMIIKKTNSYQFEVPFDRVVFKVIKEV